SFLDGVLSLLVSSRSETSFRSSTFLQNLHDSSEPYQLNSSLINLITDAKKPPPLFSAGVDSATFFLSSYSLTICATSWSISGNISCVIWRRQAGVCMPSSCLHSANSGAVVMWWMKYNLVKTLIKHTILS
ncbi:unnamed protein product, partial [Hymenolepis diminuta]